MTAHNAELTFVDYTDGRQVGSEQYFHLFKPNVSAPARGYPLLISLNLSGFTCTPPPVVIEDQPASINLAFLTRGFKIAVVSCTSVQSDGNAATVLGNGLWHPPTDEQGQPSSLWTDPDRPMSVKDAIMVVQHLRYNAKQYDIDPDRIIVFGGSAGAVALSFAVLGPDRVGSVGSEPQDLVSSHVAAVSLRWAAFLWNMFADDALSFLPFPPSGSTGDDPATLLSQVDPYYLETFSTFEYMQVPDDLPIYLNYPEGDPDGKPLLVSRDFSVDPAVTGTEQYVHSPWFGYAFMTTQRRGRKVGQSGARLIVDQAVETAANAGSGQVNKPPIVPNAIIELGASLQLNMANWGTISVGKSPQDVKKNKTKAPYIAETPVLEPGPKKRKKKTGRKRKGT